ncbi:MAG: tetratricopeptide repeat protein [Chloroflexota bacterium]
MPPQASRNSGYLPTPLSTFIGREREAAQVCERLATHRLVTLTGPGGCGKTRLAIKAASKIEGDFENGVWLTELAPLSDPEVVPQAVATTLGLHEHRNRDLVDELIHSIGQRHALVIFDNCEHLIQACARLAETLLQKCPRLQILATSREPLAIASEVIYNVPPLTLPDLQPWRDPASGYAALSAYAQSESVQLFLERGKAVFPQLGLTLENGAQVAEICRRLDGMPLAIELAAARVRALSVQQIAERLDDRFKLLTTGSRTAPPRHQTLAATLDWSYVLLSETECRVLQRLSIFAGGTTLEAAEFVCAEDGDEILDTLSHLVDKSLVTVDWPQGGETRYILLETIRQYAQQKLLESGNLEQSRRFHLDYFIEWAERAEPNLWSAQQVTWLDRYEWEHDNLRAALEFATSFSPQLALRLAAACGRFWRLRGYLSEGRAHLGLALVQTDTRNRSLDRARGLTYAANLAYLQSDYPAMRPLGEEALSIWREHGTAGRAGAAHVLDLMGELATEEGDYNAARGIFQEAIEIFKELEDQRGLADMEMQIGWAEMRTGHYREAKQHLDQFLALAQQSGDQQHLAFAYSGLGEVAVREGEQDLASRLLEKSLALNQGGGDKWGTAACLGSLGWVALRRGDYRKMKTYLGESISVRTEIGDQGGIAWCLERLAEVDFLHGRFQPAARTYACAAALRTEIGSIIDPVDQPEYQRIISGLRAILGEKEFAAAWAEGESAALEEVIEQALSGLDEASLMPSFFPQLPEAP